VLTPIVDDGAGLGRTNAFQAIKLVLRRRVDVDGSGNASPEQAGSKKQGGEFHGRLLRMLI
jgi:hypothetical protein